MDKRDIDWLLTEFVNVTNEYGCADTHIFATCLHNTIIEKGYELTTKETLNHYSLILQMIDSLCDSSHPIKHSNSYKFLIQQK